MEIRIAQVGMLVFSYPQQLRHVSTRHPTLPRYHCTTQAYSHTSTKQSTTRSYQYDTSLHVRPVATSKSRAPEAVFPRSTSHDMPQREKNLLSTCSYQETRPTFPSVAWHKNGEQHNYLTMFRHRKTRWKGSEQYDHDALPQS